MRSAAGTMTKEKPRLPIQSRFIYLAHCGVSPLYSGAHQRITEISADHSEVGSRAFGDYTGILDRLHTATALLLKTGAENISFVKNTSEALGLVAQGYPFRRGDEIISYIHEYPANHYPWRLQESRGVVLKLLPNRDPGQRATPDLPGGWLISDLERNLTRRTRLVAVSHVQFTSGFAANLQELGALCQAHNVDLVIDAAQSLGALPLYPEHYGISAIASSGWKWLLGPVGTGLLYTSPDFRAKLGHVMAGAELMEQGSDYLDHTWRPLTSGKRFEYSTSPVYLAAGLEASITGAILPWTPEAIREEIFRLQDILIENLDSSAFTPQIFPAPNRSGILSFRCRRPAARIVQALDRENVVVSERGGYLRVAPHYYNTPGELAQAAAIMNRVGSQS